jgi:hypothetical protein
MRSAKPTSSAIQSTVLPHEPLVVLSVPASVVTWEKHRLKTVQTNAIVSVDSFRFTARALVFGNLH